MKSHVKKWKDRRGVSPVIATILMVAITVVLAAVLYVMVMDLTGDIDQPPHVELTKKGDKIIITINPATAFDAKSLRFSVNDEPQKWFAELENGKWIGESITIGEEENPEAKVTFHDSGRDDKVTTADYFTYEGTGTLEIFWVSGDTVQLLRSIKF